MFGFWKVTALKGEDGQGAANIAEVVSCMNENLAGTLYLPPYLRPNQCEIDKGGVVVGFLDDVTGKGAAFCGLDKADYGYFLDSELELKKKLTVLDEVEISKKLTAQADIEASGNIKGAECEAGGAKLSSHTHNYTCSATGAAAPTTSPLAVM